MQLLFRAQTLFKYSHRLYDVACVVVVRHTCRTIFDTNGSLSKFLCT